MLRFHCLYLFLEFLLRINLRLSGRFKLLLQRHNLKHQTVTQNMDTHVAMSISPQVQVDSTQSPSTHKMLEVTTPETKSHNIDNGQKQ
jgi:hypothetical protein